MKRNSGLILFNKPSGITSFDALREIKRSLGTGKVGHTGTLDKFASGLLIVLAESALRMSKWFIGCDKKYKGRIRFGIETDTLDPEGAVTAQAPLPAREDVEKILIQFTGGIMQSPPSYSAIHINGKRASELARSGEPHEMKERPVTVYKLDLVSWQPPFADIFVHCSSGTYIRSLARDIALAAGSRGHLDALLRTDIADFSLDMVLNQQGSGESGIKTKNREQRTVNSDLVLRSIDKSVVSALGLPWFEVPAQEAENILHGKPLDSILKNKPLFPSLPTGSALGMNSSFNQSAAVFEGEEIIAIIEKNGENWKYNCVLA